MAAEDVLVSVLEGSRRVSEDGSLVTYDLTKGFDISNPKLAAEALARVFFEKDAINWFKVSGDHVDFDPSYKVRIVLAEDNTKKLGDTIDDFLKDLQKDELTKDYHQQIRDNSVNATNLQAIMAVGTIRSLLYRHSEEKVYKDAIRDDFFIDLLEKLEIRSLSGKDLMDWENLPL